MSKVIEIQNDSFLKEVTQSTGLVLVDFYADWCGPCKALAPKLEEIAEEGHVVVKKINVDSSQEIASQNDVMGLPTMILFKDGFEIARISGNRSKDALLEFLKANSN